MVDYVELLNDAIAKDRGHNDVATADGWMYASVQNLVSEHGTDGAAAAWAYLCEGSMTPDEAITFTGQRFKGLFDDVGDFAKDFFADAVDDVTGSDQRLCLVDTWSDYIDWSDLGEDLVSGSSPSFYVIDVDSGVYVWDVVDL